MGRDDMVAQLRSLDARFDAAAAPIDPPGKFNPAKRLSIKRESAFLLQIAQVVVEDFTTGKIEEHQRLFDCFEQWLSEGDLYVQGAASNRLLVSLEEFSSERRISPAAIYPIMGPRVHERWNELATIRIADNSLLTLRGMA